MRLNAAWAGDITACWTSEGWSYLAIVMDLASRQIVGWALERTLDTPVVIDALACALLARAPHRPRLFHSDQGTQYASAAFAQILAAHGITASMSRRGNCWDNAPIESFFSTLKTEAWPTRPWPDVASARAAIASYIDDFYNRRRLHSALNYQSPMHYAQQLPTAV